MYTHTHIKLREDMWQYRSLVWHDCKQLYYKAGADQNQRRISLLIPWSAWCTISPYVFRTLSLHFECINRKWHFDSHTQICREPWPTECQLIDPEIEVNFKLSKQTYITRQGMDFETLAWKFISHYFCLPKSPFSWDGGAHRWLPGTLTHKVLKKERLWVGRNNKLKK